MFPLGVFLDVEKDAIDVLKAEVQSLQYVSAICLVQLERQSVN